MKDKKNPSLKVKIPSSIKPEVQDIEERIDNLIKYTGNNSKEINNLSVDSSEDLLNKTEKHFNNNSQSLGFLEEIISDVGLNNLDADYIKKYELIQRTYRSIQNNYFTKKIEILNEKTKKYTEENNGEIRQSVEKATSEMNKITENLLLSVISIFLGVSLVTAMITGIEKNGYYKHVCIFYYNMLDNYYCTRIRIYLGKTGRFKNKIHSNDNDSNNNNFSFCVI